MNDLLRSDARKALKEKQDKFTQEQEDKYKKSLKSVMATKEGRFVLRVIMNKCKAFQTDQTATPQQRLVDSYLRDLYFIWIRPYLKNPQDLER